MKFRHLHFYFIFSFFHPFQYTPTHDFCVSKAMLMNLSHTPVGQMASPVCTCKRSQPSQQTLEHGFSVQLPHKKGSFRTHP